MKGLTNNQVETLGKKCLEKNFLGVYPSDIIPSIEKKVTFFSVIFNLSHHFESGSHFVAIFANKKCIYYFDSYGKKCNNPHIKIFLKDSKRKIISNNVPIQSLTSIFCGIFCLSFLKHCEITTTENPFKDFIPMFNKIKLTLNDKIVTDVLIYYCKMKIIK